MKIYVDLDHVDITEYTQIESGEYNTNKINFIFTPEYKDLVKVAIFGSKLDTEEPKFYKIYLSDDSCYLPSEVTSASDVISIGVYAFNVENGELKLRYSPTPVKTIVYEGSFREEAENSSSPTPTEIEQIMSRIISLEEITSDLNTRVEALENKACDLDSIKEDVETLKSDVESISGRLDTAESDIDDLEGDIANTYSKTEVDTLLGNKVDTTTFNSSQAAQDEKINYAELILSQLPKVTGEGNNISLSPTLKGKLEVDSLSGDTIQEGTPTPDTPVPIQVVTGTQEIKVINKNLIDFSNSTLTGYYGTAPTRNDNSITGGWGYYLTFPNPIPAGTYTLSYEVSNNDNAGGSTLALQDETNANISGTSKGIGTSGTKTATFTCATPIKRIKVDNGKQASTTTVSNIMLEVGSTATTYSPYTSQSYTLHLGDLELAKIGTYQDYIYYDNGKWYKYGAIGKVIFNGSENWNFVLSGTKGICYRSISDKLTSKVGLYSNYFNYAGTNGTWQSMNNYYIAEENNTNIFIRDDDMSSKSEWTAWLGTHNMTLMYVLATATSTEITDETLLSDLENIRNNAMSYSGTTNISTSGNLPIIISASALKQLS